jgi:hypothetical protein
MKIKMKTFPPIFVYDKDLSDVLLAFGKPRFNFRTVKGVAEELGKTENDIMRIIMENPYLFVANVQNPELISLNVDL